MTSLHPSNSVPFVSCPTVHRLFVMSAVSVCVCQCQSCSAGAVCVCVCVYECARVTKILVLLYRSPVMCLSLHNTLSWLLLSDTNAAKTACRVQKIRNVQSQSTRYSVDTSLSLTHTHTRNTHARTHQTRARARTFIMSYHTNMICNVFSLVYGLTDKTTTLHFCKPCLIWCAGPDPQTDVCQFCWLACSGCWQQSFAACTPTNMAPGGTA